MELMWLNHTFYDVLPLVRVYSKEVKEMERHICTSTRRDIRQVYDERHHMAVDLQSIKLKFLINKSICFFFNISIIFL